jgi:hypothetical protein
MVEETPTGRTLKLMREEWEAPLRDEIKRLTAALNYVANNTYCGADAKWHFKPRYDPRVVLDALEEK